MLARYRLGQISLQIDTRPKQGVEKHFGAGHWLEVALIDRLEGCVRAEQHVRTGQL